MLTIEIFKKRVDALWSSQKSMAAAKKWKSGRRAGTIRRAAMPIKFTKHELEHWLWKRVGLNAIVCPYCGAAIDILSLTLDHVHPRSAGGEFSLSNMAIICEDCNHRKGNLTESAFVALLVFSRDQLSPYDQKVLLDRLKAAHSGSPSRFFRDQKNDSAPPAAKAPQKSLPRQASLNHQMF